MEKVDKREYDYTVFEVEPETDDDESDLDEDESRLTSHGLFLFRSRRVMVVKIVRHLQQLNPEACNKFHDKVPCIAKLLESHLHAKASSFEAYLDSSTLKERIESMARELLLRSKRT